MEFSDISIAELRGQMIMHRRLMPLIHDECNDMLSPSVTDEALLQLENTRAALDDEKAITERLLRCNEELEEQLLKAQQQIAELTSENNALRTECDDFCSRLALSNTRTSELTAIIADLTKKLASVSNSIEIQRETAELSITRGRNVGEDDLLMKRLIDIAHHMHHTVDTLFHSNDNSLEILKSVYDMQLEEASYRHISAIKLLEKQYLQSIQSLIAENEKLAQTNNLLLDGHTIDDGAVVNTPHDIYGGCCKQCAKIVHMWELKYNAAIQKLCSSRHYTRAPASNCAVKAVQCNVSFDELKVPTEHLTAQFERTEKNMCLLYDRMRNAIDALDDRLCKLSGHQLEMYRRQQHSVSTTHEHMREENRRLKEKCRKMMTAVKAKHAELLNYRSNEKRLPSVNQEPVGDKHSEERIKHLEIELDLLQRDCADKLSHEISNRIAAEERAESFAIRAKELENLLSSNKTINIQRLYVNEWGKRHPE